MAETSPAATSSMDSEVCGLPTPDVGAGVQVPAVRGTLTGAVTTLTDPEVERLWQRLLYEGTQHTNRVNFYLVAQSMFFAAFASDQRSTIYFSIICAAAGIIMSLVWMQMAREQDVVVLRTRELLRQNAAEFREFAPSRPGRRITQRLLSVYLPTSMILLWLLAVAAEFLTKYTL